MPTMPPPRIADLGKIDVATIEYGPDEIRKRNPHRHEMELLDGVLRFDPKAGIIVGMHQTSSDDFWVRGHIPGRPLMPGVLMIEAAAQLCSFYWVSCFPDRNKFFGFGGIGRTRFRGTVAPGDMLVIVGEPIQIKTRRAIFNAQGYVDDRMVFETEITGMPLST